MATVPYRVERHEDYEDQDDSYHDPLAVADAGYSDAARAAADCQPTHTRASANSSGCHRQPQARRRLRPHPAASRSAKRRLHRIAEVRQQQGVTLRNVARRLGIEMAVIRRQEQDDCDLRITDLRQWQEVLDVPMADLLEEGEGQLSGPVLARSRMVKLMKTAAAIREQIGEGQASRLTDQLIGQILEIMPELADVTPWHTVGQRRTLDDVGRTARDTVPDELFRR
jgi:transcriptional regulator with XRE-family HTH domain